MMDKKEMPKKNEEKMMEPMRDSEMEERMMAAHLKHVGKGD